MTEGLLYSCIWKKYNGLSWGKQGYEMLLFIGTESIYREDGVVVTNYRFHDVIENKSVLFDKGLITYCKEIKGDNHECD